jgi:type II secretion system protein N
MNVRMKLPTFISAGGNGKARFRARLVFSLAAAFILLFAFLVSFIMFFPEQPLRECLERTAWQQSGGKVTIDSLSLAPPLGLRLTKIGWQPIDPKWPPITIDSARISPLWTTLLKGDPGVAVQAALSSGTLKSRMTKDGSFEATLAGIVLRPLLPRGFAYLPEGTIEGSIQGTQMLLPEKRHATFDLTINRFGVGGLKSLGVSNDRLSLGQVNIRGELRGKTLDIKELHNIDGDLGVDGKATLLLGGTPHLCRITANIGITPGPHLDPTLRGLLPLSGVKPDKQGTYRFRIGGSLDHPVLR